MIARRSEWLLWMDDDAIFTDMNFTFPYDECAGDSEAHSLSNAVLVPYVARSGPLMPHTCGEAGTTPLASILSFGEIRSAYSELTTSRA